MKTTVKIVALMLCSFLFIQCDELDEYTMFDLEFTSSVSVPASSGLNLPFDLFTQDVTTNAESEFSIHDTNKESVEEITLTEMKLTITSPGSQRFDFLKSIEIFLEADGLSEIRIAYLETIPDNVGAELDLTTVENNLREYIIKDKFKLRAKIVTDEFITEKVDIDIYSKYHVDAKVLGL
jgi:hypothetical protein